MRATERLIAVAVLAGTAGAGLVAGQMTGASPAEASANRAYTLRVGDRVAIPAIKQMCTVSTEGGAIDLFCARPLGAHHQVTIFRDSILVWRVGNPDRPAWSGKP